MIPLLSAQKMKQSDLYTIHKIGIPSLVLMERASLAVVEEMVREKCDLRSILVVCGSGNNGGDGFAIARLLHERGIPVTIGFAGKPASMTKETMTQKQICENLQIKISSNYMDDEYTTIVDALFGIGLSREITGEYAELIHWINLQKATKVAVDIPSGVNADNGKIMGIAVHADITVTFAAKKIGQILYPGADCCGKLICRSIGIPIDGKDCFWGLTEEELSLIPKRNAYSNKGTFGKVLLIVGSEGMCGAACMAAKAAYRSGCGLVRIFTPECNRSIIQTFLPEAIVTTWTSENYIMKLEESLKWADVVGIGPGLGISEEAKNILHTVMKSWKKSLVIDADGINLLAENPEFYETTQASLILTPHIGEMARLCGSTVKEIQNNLVGYARTYAKKYHLICVLKDARTILSDGTDIWINLSGNSGMAVGGSGDVLTGILCGLLGQHMQPLDAALTGVYLHGYAGDHASETYGTHAMLATDITAHLGQVLQIIEKN